jgi:hypothetical protein
MFLSVGSKRGSLPSPMRRPAVPLGIQLAHSSGGEGLGYIGVCRGEPFALWGQGFQPSAYVGV